MGPATEAVAQSRSNLLYVFIKTLDVTHRMSSVIDTAVTSDQHITLVYNNVLAACKNILYIYIYIHTTNYITNFFNSLVPSHMSIHIINGILINHVSILLNLSARLILGEAKWTIKRASPPFHLYNFIL